MREKSHREYEMYDPKDPPPPVTLDLSKLNGPQVTMLLKERRADGEVLPDAFHVKDFQRVYSLTRPQANAVLLRLYKAGALSRRTEGKNYVYSALGVLR
ncbi:hypothetical protein K0U83_23410 [bacterium]|nr:hypothetical protein [bacterium]